MEVTDLFQELKRQIESELPHTRGRALALTNLEQAWMWFSSERYGGGL